MHNAPAVSYPVGRSRFHALLLWPIVVLGALTVLGWTWLANAAGLRQWAAVLLWLASSTLAVWHWRRTPVGVLAWDGSVWTWTQADETLPVVPEVALDMQAFLLLKLKRQSSVWRIWVWPEQHTAPLHWLALRRAVFAPVPTAADAAVTAA